MPVIYCPLVNILACYLVSYLFLNPDFLVVTLARDSRRQGTKKSSILFNGFCSTLSISLIVWNNLCYFHN